MSFTRGSQGIEGATPSSRVDLSPRLVERFWQCVDKSAGPDKCWPWQREINRNGYGRFRVGKPPMRRRLMAHRVAYLITFGEIPEGLELDHLCHTRDKSCTGGNSCLHRRCANPTHSEPVTGVENSLRGQSFAAVNARKTHCPRGHEYAPENTYRYDGGRHCRTCEIAKSRRRTIALRAARNLAPAVSEAAASGTPLIALVEVNPRIHEGTKGLTR
jgi:hypothetical protein